MEMENEINIVEASDFGKKRIGFLCLPGLETFIKPIAEHFSINYNVRTCYSNNISDITSVVDWCDLVWIEWCNELATEITNKIPTLADKKVVVRLHSYEALSGYVKGVNWNVVDSLVFVAEHIKDIVIKSYPKLPEFTDIHVVPNGV